MTQMYIMISFVSQLWRRIFEIISLLTLFMCMSIDVLAFSTSPFNSFHRDFRVVNLLCQNHARRTVTSTRSNDWWLTASLLPPLLLHLIKAADFMCLHTGNLTFIQKNTIEIRTILQLKIASILKLVSQSIFWIDLYTKNPWKRPLPCLFSLSLSRPPLVAWAG